MEWNLTLDVVVFALALCGGAAGLIFKLLKLRGLANLVYDLLTKSLSKMGKIAFSAEAAELAKMVGDVLALDYVQARETLTSLRQFVRSLLLKLDPDYKVS